MPYLKNLLFEKIEQHRLSLLIYCKTTVTLKLPMSQYHRFWEE